MHARPLLQQQVELLDANSCPECGCLLLVVSCARLSETLQFPSWSRPACVRDTQAAQIPAPSQKLNAFGVAVIYSRQYLQLALALEVQRTEGTQGGG